MIWTGTKQELLMFLEKINSYIRCSAIGSSTNFKIFKGVLFIPVDLL